MKLSFERMPGWPCLAWLASFRRGDETIDVRHGEQVETRESWLCEAVWAGDFEEGDFDRTDPVFGSGCRLRNGGAVLASSGSASDRLHYFEAGAVSWVSNRGRGNTNGLRIRAPLFKCVVPLPVSLGSRAAVPRLRWRRPRVRYLRSFE
ncbi:MAG: hypothetical protein WB783_14575 [Arenicellales bacterium]